MTTEALRSANATKPSNWASKPPRMRSACMECHAAKTRCSGEKTGCQRCVSYGLACEYGMSMVGRASKRRNVNRGDGRNPPVSSPQPVTCTPLDTRPPSITVGPPIQTRPRVSSDAIFSDPIFNDAIDLLEFSPTVADDLFEVRDTSGELLSSQNFQDGTHFDGLDFTLFDPKNDDPALHSASETAPTSSVTDLSLNSQPGTSSGSSARRPSIDQQSSMDIASESNQLYGYAITLCRNVQLLEFHVQTKTKAMDKIMQISKASIASIVKITDETSFMKCKSCPPLVPTVMELIVTLYEDSFRAQEQNQRSFQPADDFMAIPQLRFGVYQIDPEEQITLRNHIICAQVKTCQEIVRKLRNLFTNQSATSIARSASAHGCLLSTWYDDMEMRIQSLLTTYSST
ncbi:hypothetical protein F5X99DRAFT_430673 [Biscogniauxia marginata]|nr:hypothetical protein F5X99DRAFT_430673 [Biscogniauxia marginata]